MSPTAKRDIVPPGGGNARPHRRFARAATFQGFVTNSTHIGAADLAAAAKHPAGAGVIYDPWVTPTTLKS